MEHWRVNSNCKVICFSCEKVFTLNNRHIFMIMQKEDDNDNHKDNHDNHNYNKIVKSDWLSTALISALIGQFNRTVRVMPK